MEKITYIARYKERENGDTLKAPVNLGDYNNWDEVLSCDILWGSINFSGGSSITLRKSKKFPTKTDDVTFFDREIHWTYVRILNLTKQIATITNNKIWGE